MKTMKIKDFAEVVTGGTPSTTKAEYWENGSIPWLNSGELNQEIVTTTRNYITEAGLNNSAAKLMPTDTVLIALTGATTGVTGYLTFEACANQSVTGILPSAEHVPKYLYYYLKSIRKKVVADAYGGAQPHISQGYVKEINVPLPSLQEQHKITSILEAADNMRQKDRLLLKKYEELEQAIFLEMFGDPLRNERGWEIDKLEDHTTVITKGETPLWKGDSYVKEGVLFVRSENVLSGKIDLTKKTFIPEKVHRKMTRSQLRKNDVLLNIVGASIGRAGIFSVDCEANINQAIAIIRLKKSLRPEYVCAVLNSPFSQLVYSDLKAGVARDNLSLGQVRNFKIVIPPPSFQQKFVSRLHFIEKQKANANTSLMKSEELFNSLLQKMFSGNPRTIGLVKER